MKKLGFADFVEVGLGGDMTAAFEAEEWAEKAQQLAKKIDKKNITDSVQASIDDVPNYYLTSLYLAELKERNAQLPKLKLQMSRFNDDF